MPNGSNDDNHGSADDDHDHNAFDAHNDNDPAAGNDGAHDNLGRAPSEHLGGPMNQQDVTIQVPTAVMNLSGNPPNDEVTEADIIKVQNAQLQAAAARINELEIALSTITNIAACALKVLADAGISDSSDEFSFSYDLMERMRDSNITATREFSGAITVRFRESSPAPILVER